MWDSNSEQGVRHRLPRHKIHIFLKIYFLKHEWFDLNFIKYFLIYKILIKFIFFIIYNKSFNKKFDSEK